MASADKLPAGRFQCYIAASSLRFFDLKIIVPLKIEVGGEIIETDEFMTVDGSLVTSGDLLKPFGLGLGKLALIDMIGDGSKPGRSEVPAGLFRLYGAW
jgi:hypothetical protein